MGPMLKEESFHLGTGANGIRRIVAQGVIPCALIQKYVNKWVSTGLDLFGVDESTSAQWAYVYGIKGRYDERENEGDADREHLNEESRGHYFEELNLEMERINARRKDGESELFIPSDKFNRSVGMYQGKKFDLHGEPFEGTDDDWNQYLHSMLPNDADEAQLQEYFKEEWICLLYTSPSPRDLSTSRMPSSA